MTEHQPNDHLSQPPEVPDVPDWAMKTALRLLGENKETWAAARQNINARVLAELQLSTGKAKAEVDKLLNAGVDGARLLATVDAAVLDEWRTVGERNQRTFEILAANSIHMAGVLPRLEAHFEVFIAPADSTSATTDKVQITMRPLTQDERLVALLALAELNGFLKDLRESDLLDFGVLLFVVATLLALIAYMSPPEDS